jgi:hypothetical protein
MSVGSSPSARCTWAGATHAQPAPPCSPPPPIPPSARRHLRRPARWLTGGRWGESASPRRVVAGRTRVAAAWQPRGSRVAGLARLSPGADVVDLGRTPQSPAPMCAWDPKAARWSGRADGRGGAGRRDTPLGRLRCTKSSGSDCATMCGYCRAHKGRARAASRQAEEGY